jgi:hypothetical protein
MVLRPTAPPVCPSAAWRLVSPPPQIDPSNKKLVAFDEQTPFARWTKAPPAVTSKEQCQQIVDDRMAARLIESPEDSENIRRVFHAFQCVCADDPRFN